MIHYRKQQKLNRLLVFIAVIFLTSFCNTKTNRGVEIPSGIYEDNLQISKSDSLEVLTGILSVDDEVKCNLYFYANYSDIRQKKLYIYNPIDGVVYTGEIAFDKQLSIKSDKVIFPCQRIIDLKEGEVFDLTHEESVSDLFAIVKSEKCFLYEKPDQLTNKKSYLVNGDFVLVKNISDKWMKISYFKNPKLEKWVQASDIKAYW